MIDFELALKYILVYTLEMFLYEVIGTLKKIKSNLQWDFKKPLRQADVLITTDLSSFEIENKAVAGQKIPVIKLNDLMKLKKLSNRPQDLVDIELIKDKLKNEKE